MTARHAFLYTGRYEIKTYKFFFTQVSLLCHTHKQFCFYLQADGHESTGCFNLDCNGFVPVKEAPITPGDTLEPANGQPKISFKIFKV